jgi:hypothetical protein
MILGPDVLNGSPTGLGGFETSTGVTFPLLLLAAATTGGNILTLYGGRDHWVVINKQGIVRYQGNDRWPYGNGYHLDELRACIDSLVTTSVGVDDALPREFALRASPNPSRVKVAFELDNPTAGTLPARVTVTDVAGRRVATVMEGVASPGVTRFSWDAGARDGRPLAPGLYLVRATVGRVTLERRLVRVR